MGSKYLANSENHYTSCDSSSIRKYDIEFKYVTVRIHIEECFTIVHFNVMQNYLRIRTSLLNCESLPILAVVRIKSTLVNLPRAQHHDLMNCFIFKCAYCFHWVVSLIFFFFYIYNHHHATLFDDASCILQY